MNPERFGRIELRDTQDYPSFQQAAATNDGKIPFFGVGITAERPSLQRSVLGSVIPGLDPEPPDRHASATTAAAALYHASTARHGGNTPRKGSGSKRPRPSPRGGDELDGKQVSDRGPPHTSCHASHNEHEEQQPQHQPQPQRREEGVLPREGFTRSTAGTSSEATTTVATTKAAVGMTAAFPVLEAAPDLPALAGGPTSAEPLAAKPTARTGEKCWGEEDPGSSVRRASPRSAAAAGVKTARRKRPRVVEHGLRVLVRGTARCGKSSILWDFCHTAALAGHRVVLVCLRQAGEEDLAHLPRSMRASGKPGDERDELRGWEASALDRIGIKYVRSREDLAWYLASLHTLSRPKWPTVIAVDDVDKIIETSAAGHIGVSPARQGVASSSGNSGNSGGALGAAALRIFALLQDTAEFFDKARAEAAAVATAAASDAASLRSTNATIDTLGTSAGTEGPESPSLAAERTAGTPPLLQEGRKSPMVDLAIAEQQGGAGVATPAGDCVDGVSDDTNADGVGADVATQDDAAGVGAYGVFDSDWRDTEERGAAATAAAAATSGEGKAALGLEAPTSGKMLPPQDVAVRVIGTCTTSDRGILSLLGRFVHAVAKVQNTTGPNCFSLRVDSTVETSHRHPPTSVFPAIKRALHSENDGNVEGGGGQRGKETAVEAVDFVRSQLDGSFAVF